MPGSTSSKQKSRAAGHWLGGAVIGVIGGALIGSMGCGPRGLPNMVPIRGRVTLDGQPLTTGSVIYAPKIPGGRQAKGELGGDGTFTLTTLRPGDGAQAGEYLVSVISFKPYPGDPTREQIEAAGGMLDRESAIPKKYSDPATSGLSDSVDKRHSGVKDFALESKP